MAHELHQHVGPDLAVRDLGEGMAQDVGMELATGGTIDGGAQARGCIGPAARRTENRGLGIGCAVLRCNCGQGFRAEVNRPRQARPAGRLVGRQDKRPAVVAEHVPTQDTGFARPAAGRQAETDDAGDAGRAGLGVERREHPGQNGRRGAPGIALRPGPQSFRRIVGQNAEPTLAMAELQDGLGVGQIVGDRPFAEFEPAAVPDEIGQESAVDVGERIAAGPLRQSCRPVAGRPAGMIAPEDLDRRDDREGDHFGPISFALGALDGLPAVRFGPGPDDLAADHGAPPAGRVTVRSRARTPASHACSGGNSVEITVTLWGRLRQALLSPCNTGRYRTRTCDLIRVKHRCNGRYSVAGQ